MDINLTQQDVLDMVERQIQKGLTDKLTTIIPQAVEKMLAGLGSTGALSKSSPDSSVAYIIRAAIKAEIDKQVQVWLANHTNLIRLEIQTALTPKLIVSEIAARMTEQLVKKSITLRPFDTLPNTSELDEEE